MKNFSIQLELITDNADTVSTSNAEDGSTILYVRRRNPTGDFPVTLSSRDVIALMDMLYTMEQYTKN